MTFQQQYRAHWAEVIRVAKANPEWVGMWSVEHKRRWALRGLVLAGPVGKLP
jgi:hypothetical protein